MTQAPNWADLLSQAHQNWHAQLRNLEDQWGELSRHMAHPGVSTQAPPLDWMRSWQDISQRLLAAVPGKTNNPDWSKVAESFTAQLQQCLAMSSPLAAMGQFGQAGQSPLAPLWSLNQQLLGPMVDTAPLGALREYQRQYQRLLADSAELPQRLQALQSAVADFPQRLSRHVEKLSAELLERGESLNSLRELFDFWVDAAEAAFAEIAHSEAYCQAQGELSTLLMSLKQQRQQILDQAVEASGLPSRRELDTTGTRLAELRRDNRALRREMAELKQQISKLGRPAPGRKRKPPESQQEPVA